MQGLKDDPRNKKGLTWLIVCIVVFVLVAVGLAAALIINAQSSLHMVAAQQDIEAQHPEISGD